MKIGLELDDRSLHATIRKTAAIGPMAEGLTKDLVTHTLQYIATNARANLEAHFTGELVSSIGWETEDGGLTGRVYADAPHAGAVEFGTGTQNKVPSEFQQRYKGSGKPHTPPSAALIPWVQAKLDTGGEDPAIVAFLVARSIGRRGGLKPRPFLVPALEQGRGEFETQIEQLARDIESEAPRL